MRGEYPRTPQWYNNFLFPGAIPFPLPLVTFYYHNRIRQAGSDRERVFWERLIEFELAMLFAVAWYSEAVHGRRGYVLPLKTVIWLQERLGDVPLVAGTGPGGMDVNFVAIAQLMDKVRMQDPEMHNIAQFPRHYIEDATFVWTHPGTGLVDTVTPAGRTAQAQRGGRLYFTDTEQGPARVNFNYANQEDYTPRPTANRSGVRFREDNGQEGDRSAKWSLLSGTEQAQQWTQPQAQQWTQPHWGGGDDGAIDRDRERAYRREMRDQYGLDSGDRNNNDQDDDEQPPYNCNDMFNNWHPR